MTTQTNNPVQTSQTPQSAPQSAVPQSSLAVSPASQSPLAMQSVVPMTSQSSVPQTAQTSQSPLAHQPQSAVQAAHSEKAVLPPVLIVYNARLVDSGIDCAGAVVCAGKKIRAVLLGDFLSPESALHAASAVLSEGELSLPPVMFDAASLVLMPAFVDMHAHFRYPGQTQKEDLDSGLRAAVAGGFGTVVLMANTQPVTSSAQQALQIMSEADSKGLARVIQAVSITKDFSGENTSAISTLNPAQLPLVSEDGKDVESAAVLYEGMKSAGKSGIIVSCHCEDVALAKTAKTYRMRAVDFIKKYPEVARESATDEQNAVLDSINLEIEGCFQAANELLELAEDIATERDIKIAMSAGCHVHICHCSTEKSMNEVRAAKKLIFNGKAPAGFDCTVEVTPHHLALAGTDEPYIRAIVNPPLRSEENRVALIRAIKDGTVDAIATDHAPHTKADKEAGSPGFSGLETAFAVCNTYLAKREGISLNHLSRLMSARPAEILGLKSGKLRAGYDADLVLVDLNEVWTVESAKFKSKGKYTPFEGARLTGRVRATFCAGRLVFAQS